MTVSSVYSAANTAATNTSTATKSGLGSLGASDFLKLLTTQLKQQDPTNPMDQKDMLAQMAQFSSLSATTEMNATLKAIAVKLGAIEAPADTSGSNNGIAA